MLTWVRDNAAGRTAVQFTLSLSLDRSYYHNASINDTITLPGTLRYGDSNELNEDVMMEVYHIIMAYCGYLIFVSRLLWLPNHTSLLRQFYYTRIPGLVTMVILGRQLMSIVVGATCLAITGKQCNV